MDVSAAIPDWLEVAAGVAAALTTLLVLGGLVARSKLGRWIWRTNVTEPFDEWTAKKLDPLRKAIEQIQADIAPTNGDRSSISDRVDKARKVAEQVKADLDQHRTDEGEVRERRQAEVDERLDRVEEKLTTGQNEIKGAITAVAESRPTGR